VDQSVVLALQTYITKLASELQS